DKDLRDKLARVVEEAREVAETAARYTLQQLSIGESSPYKHLSTEERDLRRRLRAHGRQLGDIRNSRDETQEIERLLEEVAYQHWHRMLFAKFLAENNLLMYPDPVSPVPVSLEECEELARDEGAKDGWELASRFAQNMLPQIFRADSPVFEIDLAPEYQRKLEDLLDELPSEVFEASDSLGWVYQFWQAKNKYSINKSEVKIGERELPAVTQLFTDPYMVSFLLDNTIGVWWAKKQLTDTDLENAKCEQELREKISLPGVPLEYLRFVREPAGNWAPACVVSETWPDQPAELKILDPCCGSGHFLVASLLMLAPMRERLENLGARDAVAAVLRDNLFGLEIDQRCIEIAAFSLALAAWRYSDPEHSHEPLPSMNLACTGSGIGISKREWLEMTSNYFSSTTKKDFNADGIAEYTELMTKAGNTMEELYNFFEDAPLLGSLINPHRVGGDVFSTDYHQVAQIFDDVVKEIDDRTRSYDEIAVAAHGLSKAAMFLSRNYHFVVTNVPYLGKGKQDQALLEFTKKHFPDAHNNLATVFLSRILDWLPEGGVTSVVVPQSLLRDYSYRHLRKRLLQETRFIFIAELGPHAFEAITGEVVDVILLVLQRETPSLNTRIRGLDVISYRDPLGKASALVSSSVLSTHQSEQSRHPRNVISLYPISNANKHLSFYGKIYQGLSTGDDGRFVRYYWEFGDVPPQWKRMMANIDSHGFSGMTSVLLWPDDNCELARSKGARIQGRQAWGKRGLIISSGKLLAATYFGDAFNKVLAAFVPYNDDHLAAIYCFVNSEQFVDEVRKFSKDILVTPGVFSKVPFDLEFWSERAASELPFGLPKPFSDDPTQWIFHGHPARTPYPLHVAVARLLGYRWPAEIESGMVLSDETREWVGRVGKLVQHIEQDGLLCIPSVRGERSAVDRLVSILAEAYGSDWSTAKLSGLLAEVDHSGGTLESWLRDKFFVQHFTLFGHRPFIWQIWDGLSDGFSVLVNYHKLDRRKLETLIYTYLGDWILRQKSDIVLGVDGAKERLDAAESLKQKLELILVGEAPHDIFVRWKPIEDQPIGWEPDINDGVRINIRPFMTVGDVRKKGAGVLRDKPN
ncbi:MAG: N-6 DNA methylase, partial [Firmicutes bacterium]|nr:N-6 DNA methylase [Bacillota bacterium]